MTVFEREDKVGGLLRYGIPNMKLEKQVIDRKIQIMEEEGIADYTIVSVSNAFHIPRIKLICSRLNCDSEFILAKDPNPYAMFAALVREYMAYGKLFLLGAE